MVAGSFQSDLIVETLLIHVWMIVKLPPNMAW